MTKPLTVLMTSVGNDGFPAVLQAVKSNTEREIRVIGVDIRPSAPGLYLADKGYLVPSRNSPEELIQELLKLCRANGVQLLYPLSTEDQEFFAFHSERFAAEGILITTCPLESVRIANDKLRLYDFANSHSVPCPRYEKVGGKADFVQAAHRIGYPERPFVLKLNRGTGGQGVKIVYPTLDAQRRMFDRDNRNVAFDEVKRWLDAIPAWPPMHLTEYLPGQEYSVDILCDSGRILAAVTRLRLSTLYGLALHAQVVHEEDVQELACELAKKLNLRYVVNVQVRRSADGTAKLMEINPRIPGTIGLTVASGINMPYLAIKLSLGEPLEIHQRPSDLTILRYWNAVYVPTKNLL